MSAIAGDPSALEALLPRAYDPVRNFLRRRLGANGDLDEVISDITQDVLLHVAQGIRSCQARTLPQFMAWVLAIAKHTMVDHLRSPRGDFFFRRLAEESVDLEDLAGIPTPSAAVLAPSGTSQTLLRLVFEAYSAMPAQTAELMWYHLVAGMGWHDAADVFGTSPAGAKRRYQRAQETLRRTVYQRIHSLPPDERARVLEHLARWGFREQLEE